MLRMGDQTQVWFGSTQNLGLEQKSARKGWWAEKPDWRRKQKGRRWWWGEWRAHAGGLG